MPRYVAFLRGINVGGHRVKMDHLRGLFEQLDVGDVSTFIASGNVLFSTDSDDREALRTAIEDHLESELGYGVGTFLRTPAELAEIAALDARGASDEWGPESSHYVVFLQAGAPSELREGLVALESEIDDFDVTAREVHWRTRGKVSESPLFGQAIERVFRGTPNTMRNMNTVKRLVAKTAHAE